MDLDIATRRFDRVGVSVDQAVPAFSDSYPAWWATMLRPSLMRVRLRFQDSYLAINAEVIELWLAEPAGRPIERVGCAPRSDVSLSIESYRRYDAVTLVGVTFWVHRRYREIVQQWLSSTWTPPRESATRRAAVFADAPTWLLWVTFGLTCLMLARWAAQVRAGRS